MRCYVGPHQAKEIKYLGIALGTQLLFPSLFPICFTKECNWLWVYILNINVMHAHDKKFKLWKATSFSPNSNALTSVSTSVFRVPRVLAFLLSFPVKSPCHCSALIFMENPLKDYFWADGWIKGDGNELRGACQERRGRIDKYFNELVVGENKEREVQRK